MDEVMQLARRGVADRATRAAFPSRPWRSGGLEAVLNTLLEPGDRVSVDGSTAYAARSRRHRRRRIRRHRRSRAARSRETRPSCRTSIRTPGAHVDRLTSADTSTRVPDLWMRRYTLGGCELRTDDWGVDVRRRRRRRLPWRAAGHDAGHLLDRVEQAMRSDDSAAADQLSGPAPVAGVLEPRTAEPSHRADEPGLWPARGAAAGAGGRPGGSAGVATRASAPPCARA